MAAPVLVKRIAKYFPPGSGLATWNFDNRDAPNDDLQDLSGNGHDLVWNYGSASHAEGFSGMVGMQFNNNRNLVAPNSELFRIALERLGGGDPSLTIEVILNPGITTNRIIGSWADGESEATNYLYDLYRNNSNWYCFNETGNGSNIGMDFTNVPEASELARDWYPRYVALTVSANGRVRTCYAGGGDGDIPLISQAIDTTPAMKEELGSNLQRTYIGASFTGNIIGIRMWAETKDLAFLQGSYDALMEEHLERGDTSLPDRQDEAAWEDAYDIPNAGGAPLHTWPQTGRGQFLPGPATQEPDAPHGTPEQAAFEDAYDIHPEQTGLARHTFPQVSGGVVMPGSPNQPVLDPIVPRNVGAFEDILTYLSSGVPEFNIYSYDVEGHPHFLSELFFNAFYYNATKDPWHTPTLNNFTGYARNGKHYTNGTEDAGPVWAPWATEASSDHRSSRADFPLHVLVVVGTYEVVIFDLDSYTGAVASLKVWMRFYWNNADYMSLGRGAFNVRDVKIANGTLVAATRYDSSPAVNGGVFCIDFKANDQSVFALFRSDSSGTWRAIAGKTIVNRNETSLYEAEGSGVKVYSENFYRIDLRVLDTDGLLIAVVGEDYEEPAILHLENNTFYDMYYGSGDDLGEANLNDEFLEFIMFDEQGWLWTSRANRIYRHGNHYAGAQREGVHQNIGDRMLRPHIDLPHNVISMTSARDRLYVGTEAGVYVVKRGTLEFWLGYTAVGGGGRGRINTPGSTAGEILKAAHSESYRLYTISFSTASYLAVPQTYHRGGAVTIIRLYDDFVVGAYAAPDLTEDGAWFSVVTPV